VQVSEQSRILIIGQAPGKITHDSGKPWDDRSGDRLRSWLSLTTEQFYDPNLVAQMPMGFCYPGKGKSGDNPPRPECAPHWHEALLAEMKTIQLTIYIGRYALDYYLPNQYAAITQAVADHVNLLPQRIVLPHPSPRNNIWLKKHAWFEHDVLSCLQERIRTLIT
jgi:uracil-DNA glycosylase